MDDLHSSIITQWREGAGIRMVNEMFRFGAVSAATATPRQSGGHRRACNDSEWHARQRGPLSHYGLCGQVMIREPVRSRALPSIFV